MRKKRLRGGRSSGATSAASETAAAEGGSGADDCGAQAASRQPFVGEEEGETTAEATVIVDLRGEERGGRAARRWQRRLRGRAGERRRAEGEGDYECNFAKKSFTFP